MIRVLVVDDQALVRAGFSTILDSEPGIEVVGEAASGDEALAQAAALHPDVICMDVQMPGMDGLEATRRITADPGLHAAVLVLTTFNREDYLFDALAAGASGFLLKNSGPEELIAAVHVLARGDALLSPEVTRSVIASVAGRRPTAPVPEPVEGHGRTGAPGTRASTGSANGATLLTEREHEVLVLLAAGLSNAEIAARLFVGEATVKTHVSNVLAKLGIRDRVHAVVWAYENRVVAPG